MFDLGLYPQGESRSVVFENPGLVRIYCSIHQSMQGAIFVSPTPFWSLLDETGAWSIADVPAGEYILKTFSEWLPEYSQPVSIAADMTLDLKLGEE